MLDFPASPTVNQKYPEPPVAGVPVYSWDGEKWTTYGGLLNPQGPADALPLMDADPADIGISMEYAREDHIHPVDTSRASVTYVDSVAYGSMAYSGMQINGGMEVSQERGGNAVGMTSTATTYLTDGFVGSFTHSSAVFVGAQSDFGGGGVPGITKATTLNCTTTAMATLAAPDAAYITQYIEGYRWSRLSFGTAAAQPVTISFWIWATVAGTSSLTIMNADYTRSYCISFPVSAATTWEYKTITVPGDVTGTWLSNNGVGGRLYWMGAAGSNYRTGNGTWQGSGSAIATSVNTNFFASTSTYFAVTGVTIHPGTQAPTAAQSPNIMRPYGEELRTCQRYYQRMFGSASNMAFATGQAGSATSAYGIIQYPGGPMRVIPTVAASGTFYTWAPATTNITVTSIIGYYVWTEQALMNWNVASGLVAGNATTLINGNQGAVSFDARL